MSFFDEGDEPTRVTRPARPRRPSTGGRPPGDGGSTGGVRAPDQHTARVRQAVAAGIALVLLILIVLGVRGCVNSRQENALRDYNRDVTAVITDSDREVMQPFFSAADATARSEGQDLQVQVNQLRQGADDDVTRAEGFDVPDEMAEAQDNLLLVLNLRAEAIRKIADKIPTAQGRGTPARRAVEQIAGQMQAPLASDVVYSQRVAPHIKESLDDAGIEGQTIATSRSLRDLAWLNPDVVEERLGSASSGGASDDGGARPARPRPRERLGGRRHAAARRHEPRPGRGRRHVHRGRRQPGRQQRVRRPRDRERPRLGQADHGEQDRAPDDLQADGARVRSRSGSRRPSARPRPSRSSIAKVPGEQKLDNNRQRYTVLFTR